MICLGSARPRRNQPWIVQGRFRSLRKCFFTAVSRGLWNFNDPTMPEVVESRYATRLFLVLRLPDSLSNPLKVLSCMLRLPSRALMSVTRPVSTDTTWGPTRAGCAPLRVAASRLPVAFPRPEPCCRSSGAFDLRHVLGTGRLPFRRGCAPGSTRAPFGLRPT